MNETISYLLEQIPENKKKIYNNDKTVNYNSNMKLYISCIYIFGILLAIMQFYFIRLKFPNNEYLFASISLCIIVVLCLNLYFSLKDPLQDYSNEVNLYEYVEQNGRVLLTTALANGLFINVIIQNHIRGSEIIMAVIPTILAFVYAALILTIVWMPKSNSIYIRLLRDVKTVFLINSIGLLVFSMLYFINFFI